MKMNSRNILLAVVAIAALSVLYMRLKPQDPQIAAKPPAPTAASAAMPGPTAAPIAKASVSVDAPTDTHIAARVGESIEVDVSSSKPGEAGVHGLSHEDYEIKAGAVTRIVVAASTAGTFALHFHGTGGEHVPLAVIHIDPK
jgi:hypothetical protein